MAITITAVAILLIIIAGFFVQRRKDQEALAIAAWEAEKLKRRVAIENDRALSLRIEIQKKRRRIEREAARKRRELTFSALKQLHRESHLAGTAWYEQLEAARDVKDGFLRNIDLLKQKRRYHARHRQQLSGTRKKYHIESIEHITWTVDTLYEALEKLNEEISKIYRELNMYNQNTADLRDHIGASFGKQGENWRRGVLSRGQARKKILVAPAERRAIPKKK